MLIIHNRDIEHKQILSACLMYDNNYLDSNEISKL